jgi:hypothetical protein
MAGRWSEPAGAPVREGKAAAMKGPETPYGAGPVAHRPDSLPPGRRTRGYSDSPRPVRQHPGPARRPGRLRSVRQAADDDSAGAARACPLGD